MYAILLLLIIFLSTILLYQFMTSGQNMIFGSGKKKRKPLSIVTQEPWFSFIKSGKKKVEGRVGDPAMFNAHINKTVKVSVPQGEKLFAALKDVRAYDTLDEFIKAEEWKKLAPHAKSESEAKKLYLDIKNKAGAQVYGNENISAKGKVLALELELKDV